MVTEPRNRQGRIEDSVKKSEVFRAWGRILSGQYPSLSIEIARECREAYGPEAELWFVCGADTAERIVGWNYGTPGAIEKQLRDYGLLVAPRDSVYEPPPNLRERVVRLTDELHADVLVMGAVSRRGLKRLFLGNTAEEVLDKLPCDLLIVKPAGFEIFDCADPSKPKSVTVFDCSGPKSRGVHHLWWVDGEYVHIASGAEDYLPRNQKDDQCYRIIDVRNPSTPTEVGRWHMPGTKQGDNAPPPPQLNVRRAERPAPAA